MTRTRPGLLRAVALVGVLALAACSGSPDERPTVGPATTAAPEERVVYVALGSDESLRGDLDDPLRNLWVQQVFSRGLPTSAELVNLATPAASVRDGIESQLPAALALQPTLATVWFGVGDQGGDDADLAELVTGLRAGGVEQVVVLLHGLTEERVAAIDSAGAIVVVVEDDPFASSEVDAQTAVADQVIAAVSTG